MSAIGHAQIALAAALILGACDPREPAPASAVQQSVDSAQATRQVAQHEALSELLASAARSAEDRARDAGRRPAEVLALLGITPGRSVIDVMAAGGWYAEVLAHAVGESGSVTAHNPPWLLAVGNGTLESALDERLRNRLANVRRLDSNWSDLRRMSTQFDAAVSALNLHDVFYRQSPEAAAEMFSSVYAVLKPGSVFGVIDHAGNAAGDNKALHRIEKELAIELAIAAGFILVEDSALLANSADDRTRGVFSTGSRGNTDRFLLKLRKPEG